MGNKRARMVAVRADGSAIGSAYVEKDDSGIKWLPNSHPLWTRDLHNVLGEHILAGEGQVRIHGIEYAMRYEYCEK